MSKKPPLDAPKTPARGAPAGRDERAISAKERSTGAEVADFVAKMKALGPSGGGRGRLIFAMDATMSREPTWDMALGLQGDMFRAVKSVGGLDVQLVYFRGAGECRASKWVSDPEALARLMTTVRCHGGYTQIGKVLAHARQEAQKRKINALVYVGDAMEESLDDLCGRAGELALLGVPVFLFQEGRDASVARAFAEIARLTNGASCRFDAGSASELRALLTAVAVYAAGGQKALLALAKEGRGEGARLLIAQLKPGG
jgi:hypothetical protein